VDPTQEPALVDRLLERILASEGFRRADRQATLLTFLVTRALHGQPGPVKEYELGVEVFGRPNTYDPRTDPIVRVGMRELRTRLSAYYAGEGAADPVRIEQPKGSYRVVFTPVAPLLPVPPDPSPSGPASWPRVALAVSVTSALLALLMIGVLNWRKGPETEAAPPGSPSVAVLPFVNLNGDDEQDYFSDGLTDEVVSALMTIDRLRVTGRTSAFAFRKTTAGPTEIGQSLGVDALLSGSVRRSGDRVRVVARLTSSRDGFELWNRTFDGALIDLLSFQAELAQSVALSLRLRLDPSSGQPFIRRSNDDARAHDLYLRARYLAHTRQEERVREAIPLFEQAITLDPGYALAHAGLADAFGLLAFNGHAEPGRGILQAREAAARAFALDPTLGEALAHLAHITAFVDWQWELAERRFRRALDLTPSHPRIHAWFGQSLVVQGRFDEGLRELLLAQRLDPLAPSITYALGEAYLYAGRHDQAERTARRLLQNNPRSWGGHNLLVRSFMAAGNAVAAAPALEPSRGELWADALALVAQGNRQGAVELIDRRGGTIGTEQPFTVASLYASAGDSEKALSWLERAYAERQVDLAALAVDPALAVLRHTPRFQTLVRRVGFAERPIFSAAR
jgi:TolB-like protein